MINNYVRQREYKQYDSSISVRINNHFYKFLYKLNPKNISATIRNLIRVDLYNGTIEVTDKDITKMFVCFFEYEREKIKEYSYRDKKVKPIVIKLYREEKEQIKRRSDGNISYYVDLIIMDFINLIGKTYELRRYS